MRRGPDLLSVPWSCLGGLRLEPARSELTYLLVSLDKEYATSGSGEPWPTYYAQRILDHFTRSGS
jgi:hypothetical protein